MFKTGKPWLNYGLGDGRDMVVHEQKKTLRKYSRAVWMFLFFGGFGGHRLYMGQPWAALRVILAQFIIIFLVSVLILMGIFGEISGEKFQLLSTPLFLSLLIFEFLSIRPGVEKANIEIEAENVK